MKKINALVILIICGLAGSTSYLTASHRYNVIEIESLTNTITAKENKILSLETSLNEKEDELQTVKLRLDTTEKDLRNLQNNYEQARLTINQLESQLTQMESNLSTYQQYYDLHIGNSLHSFYEQIREKYTPTTARTQRKINKEHCQFAVQLALHDLGQLTWPQVEDSYLEATGENSGDTAYTILVLAYNACNINSFDSDPEKIEKILAFVNEHIDYEYEVEDPKHAPVETLSLRSGDCDDYAILTAALFEMAGIQTAFGVFTNSETGTGHSMVLVHIQDLGNHRYWYYDDLTNYGLSEGKWIKIEPQTTIEYQGEDELMELYDIDMAIEIDYEHATS